MKNRLPRHKGPLTNLTEEAHKLNCLGWSTNFTKEKGIVFDTAEATGISITVDPNLVVVDIDSTRWELPWGCILPPTMKERSPRGWHLFYNTEIPLGTQIKKWPNIDLLGGLENYSSPQFYAQDKGKKDNRDFPPWERHVLCSPTPGYSLVCPDKFPNRKEITQAPSWLVEAAKEGMAPEKAKPEVILF